VGWQGLVLMMRGCVVCLLMGWLVREYRTRESQVTAFRMMGLQVMAFRKKVFATAEEV
jgi:hypothetical protein